MAAKPKPAKASDAYHHGDLRQALLDAALAEVERAGPDAISLAALARALGVSQAAPYRHFPDREALLAAVAAEGFRQFCTVLREAAARGRRTPLARMCQAYIAFGQERLGLYRLMFASRLLAWAAPDSELPTVALESFGLLVAAVPPSRRRERVAMKIWVALHGMVMLAGERLLEGPSAVTPEMLLEDILQDAQNHPGA